MPDTTARSRGSINSTRFGAPMKSTGSSWKRVRRRASGPVVIALLWAGAVFSLPLVGAEVQTQPVERRGTLEVDGVARPRFRFGGVVGQRARANVENWLIVAPGNNPGLLDMFSRRDSGVKPDLVPWAGEFVGKYLISGVQALRMHDDPKLKHTLRGVVNRLVELQAEDGYLGPWPKNERLRGHWDLWGHYHVMLGLMLWSEHTGDEQAAAAARRIGEAVCNTYLDAGSRVVDAGSHEMNMAIIHGMAKLYLETGEPRYLRMANEVLKDFERAGDYYRTGLEGKEFHRTPRPRWESLHSLQGMFELYRITGQRKYRQSFLHHWASLRRFDMRNSGGFSSGEAATGNPYRNDAIETCCVIAWQAVMIDALRLTGESTIADDLELATFNAVFGSQHPSGAWCTYNTPMNGKRIPSHINIAFQVREGTPHLNCCSVNGPRGYGTLSEWAVMRRGEGLVVNFHGPMRAEVSLNDGTPVSIEQDSDYPVNGTIKLKIVTPRPTHFSLGLRIPAWASGAAVSLNGEPVPGVEPGRYLDLVREWNGGDRLVLRIPMNLHYEAGDLDQYGKVSLYRGPILLAADSRFAPDELPPVDLSKLHEAELVPINDAIAEAAGGYEPWVAVDVPTTDGKTLRLIDFASAGAATVEGKPMSTYVSWLPCAGARPPRPVAWKPADGSKIGPGAIRFVWRRPAADALREHTVVISDSPTFDHGVLSFGQQKGNSLLVPSEAIEKLRPHTSYYWKIAASNKHGRRESIGPYKRFTIDPSAPVSDSGSYGQRPQDMMVAAVPLQGDVKPEYGVLMKAKGWKPAAGPKGSRRGAIELDGKSGFVKFELISFPEENYTVSIWTSVAASHGDRFGQLFSAWAAGMDDPLRLVVTGGKLFGRIEAGRNYGTEGVAIAVDKWYHVVGVKHGDKLTVHLDGRARTSANVPRAVRSNAMNFAIGGNPNFSGAPEFLAAKVADLRFFARALSAEEVKQLYDAGCNAD